MRRDRVVKKLHTLSLCQAGCQGSSRVACQVLCCRKFSFCSLFQKYIKKMSKINFRFPFSNNPIARPINLGRCRLTTTSMSAADCRQGNANSGVVNFVINVSCKSRESVSVNTWPSALTIFIVASVSADCSGSSVSARREFCFGRFLQITK